MATTTTDNKELNAVKAEFNELVNMSASQLGTWLGTKDLIMTICAKW